MAPPLIDPELFDQLKAKIEEDTGVRKELDQILDDLNQEVSFTQGLQSRIHSTPRSKCQSGILLALHNPEADVAADPALLGQLEGGIAKEIETVGKLSAFASQHPYYK
jgi:hypothetical protein